jgi:hypothetical protein
VAAAEAAAEPVAAVELEPEVVPVAEAAAEPVPAAEAAAEPTAVEPTAVELEPEVVPIAAFGRSDEPIAIGVMAGVDDLISVEPSDSANPQPTGDELLAAAEAAEEAGDDTALRSLLLWTARAYAREGRFEAGLDATHRLLMRSPSDVDAHLVLVEMYVSRSWDALAAEKLLLLGRLADLDGDEVTRRRLCQAASRAFPGNERLEALCS